MACFYSQCFEDQFTSSRINYDHSSCSSGPLLNSNPMVDLLITKLGPVVGLCLPLWFWPRLLPPDLPPDLPPNARLGLCYWVECVPCHW